MSKRLFLVFALISLCFSGIAQELTGIAKANKQRDELFKELSLSKEDTNKVKLLFSLCNLYSRNKNTVDSVSFYAEKARTLSQKLRRNEDFNQASLILCKSYLFGNQVKKALSLLPDMQKDQQARLSLVIGEHYLFQPGLQRQNLDSALGYFNEALRMSKSIGSEKWRHESLIALGKYYFANDQFIKAKDCFLEIISDFQRAGNRSAEAHIWSELGIYMPDTDSSLKDELWAHGNALRIYQELKDTANETSVLQDMGGVNMNHANFDTSRSQYLRALQLRKASGMKKLYKIYLSLSWISYCTGKLDEALALALESEKNARLLGTDEYNSIIYMMLGQIYGEDGQAEKSLQYLLAMGDVNTHWRYFVYSKIVEQYLRLNQPQKALLFIRNAEKKNPPGWISDKETLAATKGDIYAALKNPAEAEKYYLQMIQLDEEAQKTRSREIASLAFPISGSEAYYKIAKFYESQHKYSAAGKYADRALQFHSFSGNHFFTSHLVQKIWWLKFKVDSASGNYFAAIQHYEKYTALKDSIFSATKSNQLQQLQVQYETEKKEDSLKIKDKDIMVLNQDNQLQQTRLKQANLVKNVTIGGILLLFVIMGLLYNQYRHKQKNNKVITQKNDQLQHLLTEKEWLLTEKEWLLKEVHHRVKNNLHTVICLLESQAAYLESDAREANEISQQRIYTMSLIHQKIYQSDDVKTIDMSVYLPELIQYLDDSFGNSRQIHFEVNIDPVQLDISQAVPVALIINEAVTNSIKYAFPGSRRGTIEVTMRQDAEQIMLTVADNGIGIDSALIDGVSDSLGLQLIKGLSKDIKARLNFENIAGTRISIVFHLDPLNRNDYTLKVLKKEGLYV